MKPSTANHGDYYCSDIPLVDQIESSEPAYKVVTNASLISLGEKVNALIKEGYEPLGGATTASFSPPSYWVQTMIRKDL